MQWQVPQTYFDEAFNYSAAEGSKEDVGKSWRPRDDGPSKGLVY